MVAEGYPGRILPVMILAVCLTTTAIATNEPVRPAFEATVVDAHDFHISKTRLEFAAEQQEWQLSLHVFIDDLELGLMANTDQKIYLGTERENLLADSLIHRYLQDRLELVADGKRLQLDWLGKEVTEDLSAFWVYLYVPEAQLPQTMAITNRVLLELYDDQQNIVQLVGPGGVNKHLLFHRDAQRENIQF